MKKIIIVLFFLFLPASLFAELPLREKPITLIIKDDLGGKLDGTPWSSEEMLGHITTLMYVDPDETNLNEHVENALKAMGNDQIGVKSVAVINLAATWKPNWLIESILEGKQKKFPNTVYVRDLKSVLVKEWNLRDDSYDVLLFDREGKVLFSRDGALSPKDVKKLIALIEEELLK